MSKESAETKTPTVCVVLLNWNGIDHTIPCLESLALATYPALKVVVIDNGSENQEAEQIKAKFPQFHLIENEENQGFTGGCNQGIEYSRSIGADYVFLLNNDTTVTPDFMEPLVEHYETCSGAGIVSPIIAYPDGETIWYAGAIMWFGLVRHRLKGKKLNDTELPLRPYKTGYVPGAALLISNKLIDKIGPLDPRLFIYYEDYEWGIKAKAAGKYSYVVPNSLIYHVKSASSKSVNRFTKWPSYLLGRNAVLVSTEMKGLRKYVHLAAQVLIKLPVSLAYLIEPSAWSQYCKGVYDGFKWIITGKEVPRR